MHGPSPPAYCIHSCCGIVDILSGEQREHIDLYIDQWPLYMENNGPCHCTIIIVRDCDIYRLVHIKQLSNKSSLT